MCGQKSTGKSLLRLLKHQYFVLKYILPFLLSTMEKSIVETYQSVKCYDVLINYIYICLT